MLLKHGPTKRVDFTEGDGLHSCSLESETESADAGEEVKYPHLPFRLISQKTQQKKNATAKIEASARIELSLIGSPCGP
jgi:hypothetical protein